MKNNFVVVSFASVCLLFSFCEQSNEQKINTTKDFTGYYELINKYEICKAESDSVGAYQNLKLALDNYNGFCSDYDDLIEMELKKGNREAAIKYAQKMVSMGYQFFNEDLEKLGKIKLEYKDSVFIKKIITEYPKWRKEYLNKRSEYYNLLNIELNCMHSVQGYVRGQIDNKDSTFWKYTYQVDSINYFELKNIILEQGFPDRTKLDSRAFLCLRFLLLNSRVLSLITKIDEREMQWIDSTVRMAVINGNIFPEDYAGNIDRYYCFKAHIAKKDDVQLYGEFNNIDSSSFIPIMDIENVDKRRKDIFLVPLKYQAKLSNLKLPEGYK